MTSQAEIVGLVAGVPSGVGDLGDLPFDWGGWSLGSAGSSSVAAD